MKYGPPETPPEEPEMQCSICDRTICPYEYEDEGCEYCNGWEIVKELPDHVIQYVKDKLNEPSLEDGRG